MRVGITIIYSKSSPVENAVALGGTGLPLRIVIRSGIIGYWSPAVFQTAAKREIPVETVSLESKLEKMKGILRELERVAVAFSAGVDSTLVLKVALDTL